MKNFSGMQRKVDRTQRRNDYGQVCGSISHAYGLDLVGMNQSSGMSQARRQYLSVWGSQRLSHAFLFCHILWILATPNLSTEAQKFTSFLPRIYGALWGPHVAMGCQVLCFPGSSASLANAGSPCKTWLWASGYAE